MKVALSFILMQAFIAGLIEANSLDDLKVYIFNSYNSMKIPLSIKENKEFNFTLQPVCFNIDMKTGKVYGDLVTISSWINEELLWNPEDFNGANGFTYPLRKMWLPNIALHKSATSLTKTAFPKINEGLNQLLVLPDGTTVYIQEQKFVTYCDGIDRSNPLLPQSCSLVFSSWTDEEEFLKIRPHNERLEFILDGRQWYRESCPFQLISKNRQENSGSDGLLFKEDFFGSIGYNITVQNKFHIDEHGSYSHNRYLNDS